MSESEADVARNDVTLAGAFQSSASLPTDELARGAVIDRYVVLGRLGSGGMGVVYAAHDPELDRKVALKLLRCTDPVARAASRQRTRLLREAQALAKLQHPNVVTIHDVGTHEDRVWIAMEFVDGQTLGTWARERPRSWTEALDVLVPAVRGVAAAHAAGLLHRDLKPDNIMVSADGRVRVLDFGVVRHEAAVEPSDGEDDENAAPLVAAVTQAGAVVGTPGYIAPEQFVGERLGPASDQFSLCVTAWELLYGKRPFTGERAVESSVAVIEGRRLPAPTGANVPRWLRRVLDRGLAPDPAMRWPSLDALLAAIERGRTRARTSRVFAAIGVVIAVGGGIAGGRVLAHHRGLAGCADEASLADVWNEARAARIAAAFADTGVSYATDTWMRARPQFDAHAAQWRATRTEVCTSEIEESRTPALVAAARGCLDEVRDDLAGVLDELERPDAVVIQLSASASASLRSPQACTDEARVRERAAWPTDSEQHERWAALRTRLAQARAAGLTGRDAEAATRAQAVLDEASALAFTRLELEAQLVLGRAQSELGQLEDARRSIESAFYRAGAAGRDELAFHAATSLIRIVGDRLARHETGLQWQRFAEMLAERLGHTDDSALALLLRNTGALHVARGALDDARTAYERALEIEERVAGPNHLFVADVVNGLGIVATARGEFDTALALHRRALAINEASHGPEHPDTAIQITNIGVVYLRLGQLDDALGQFERALAIFERSLGPDHPNVAGMHINIGTVRVERSEYDKAAEHFARALAVSEKIYGPQHPLVAGTLHNIGEIDARRGRPTAARASLERALAIREAVYANDHPEIADSCASLAEVHRKLGADERALELYRRALAIREQALGPEHVLTAQTLFGIGVVYEQRREYDESLAALTRALAIVERTGERPHRIAQIRFALARALWETETDRARAYELARAAREGLGEGAQEGEAASVDTWLREHAVGASLSSKARGVPATQP